MTHMHPTASARFNVLPVVAAPRAWWQLPAERPSRPVLALRAAGALAAGAAIPAGAVPVLGMLAFVLIPTCTYSTPSPAGLQAAAATCLVLAALSPAVVAGRRLWWVGAGAAALALRGVWSTAWPLVTELQSGFCF